MGKASKEKVKKRREAQNRQKAERDSRLEWKEVKYAFVMNIESIAHLYLFEIAFISHYQEMQKSNPEMAKKMEEASPIFNGIFKHYETTIVPKFTEVIKLHSDFEKHYTDIIAFMKAFSAWIEEKHKSGGIDLEAIRAKLRRRKKMSNMELHISAYLEESPLRFNEDRISLLGPNMLTADGLIQDADKLSREVELYNRVMTSYGELAVEINENIASKIAELERLLKGEKASERS